jgi:hypothetical protein
MKRKAPPKNPGKHADPDLPLSAWERAQSAGYAIEKVLAKKLPTYPQWDAIAKVVQEAIEAATTRARANEAALHPPCPHCAGANAVAPAKGEKLEPDQLFRNPSYTFGAEERARLTVYAWLERRSETEPPTGIDDLAACITAAIEADYQARLRARRQALPATHAVGGLASQLTACNALVHPLDGPPLIRVPALTLREARQRGITCEACLEQLRLEAQPMKRKHGGKR